MLRRLGYLAVVLGVLSWTLFVVSELVQQTNYNFFFLGLVLLLFGGVALRATAPPPPSGPRYFRRLRNWRRKGKGSSGDGKG